MSSSSSTVVKKVETLGSNNNKINIGNLVIILKSRINKSNMKSADYA